jgi:putative transposase
MSTRTHSGTKHDSGGRSARVREPDGQARVAGGERSEPVGRAQRGAGDASASAAGVPGAPGSLGAWACERGLPGDAAADALAGPAGRARELPDELVDEALALARLRRDLGGGELAREVRDRLSDELVDELLAGARGEEEIVGPGGLLADLTRRLVERAMAAELTEHVGYEPHAEPPGGAGNTRNGTTPKTLQTEQGPVRITAPRDRQGTFEPQIVRKGQRRFEGFDDKIVAMYARGMTTRDIEAHLAEIYGVSVGRDTISRVTAAVLEDAERWQTRPLEALYPIVYLDALVIKIREDRAVRKHACYLAIGVNTDGEREVLGMWFQRTEGAKFWLGVLTELKQRGLEDVLVCCVDGLTGFPEAIEAVYPNAWVQTCIVHQIRSSLRFVSYRDRRAVAADLKKIYTAVDRDHAETELERFAEKWDARYPMISASWIEHWEHIVPFLAFPADVRRVIYTTNTIEALNRQLRKHIKTRGSFPDQDAARRLLYLAIVNAQKTWRTAYNWSAALAAFRIHFGDRVPDTAI